MLLQSGLSPSFWAEAVATACHIQNRCVTRSLDEGTPYDKWTGYSEDRKAYRIWIPDEKKIVTSRDVKFLDEFGPKTEYKDFVSDSEEALNKQHIEVLPYHHVADSQSRNNDDLETSQAPEEENPDGNVEINRNQDANASTPSTRRGHGRPRLVRIGGHGRPLKVYCQTRVATDRIQDNRTVVEDVRDNCIATTQTNEVRNASENEGELSSNKVSQDTNQDRDRGSVDDDEELEWHDAGFAMSASEISCTQALNGPDAEEWKDAIYTEIKNLVANDTWMLVNKPNNQKFVDCRFVLRNKYNADGSLECRKASSVVTIRRSTGWLRKEFFGILGELQLMGSFTRRAKKN
nr:PREDICTED: uncharacterized protein LOC105663803 isoform X2 [Megachile rotundata]